MAGVVLAVASAQADTLTWTGKAGQDENGNWHFDDGGNWSNASGTRTVPAAGDTLTFTNDVGKSYSASNIVMSTDSSAFDISDGGLTVTVSASKKVYSRIKFTGSGQLTKSGAGYFCIAAKKGDWTGGTLVTAGKLQAGSAATFGTGTITIRPTAQADCPCLGPASWNGMQLTNRIEVVTPEGFTPHTNKSEGVIYSSNGGSWSGPIFSDNDFAVGAGSGSGALSFGPISAPGHTLYVYASSSKASRRYVFNEAVDANVQFTRNSKLDSEPHMVMNHMGRSTNPVNTLTVLAGTNQFDSADAYWGGPIVLSPANAREHPRLKLKGANNINPDVPLSIGEGAYLEIPSKVTLRHKNVFVNGARLDPGDYTKTTSPGFIAGAGTLHVVGGFLLIVR